MAGLTEKTKWENEIYRIEENDPVHGGEDGITNKPTKQLANRTKYLKQALEETEQKLNPKKLTATTKNAADGTGHTHEIDLASTTTKGLVQLNDSWESDSREMALTARVGKGLKALIDSLTRNLNNYIPNSKKSDSVTSSSSDTVATSSAVKSAHDRAVTAENNNLFQKIYINSETLELDLTNRQQVINLFGDKYRPNGYLTFTNHNNAKSRITGLPLETRSPIVMTFYLMNGYSIFYCHYVTLNRKFYSVANLSNATYRLNWVEEISNTGEQTINNTLTLVTNTWVKQKYPIANGGEWRIEFNPSSESDPRFNFAYQMKDGSHRFCSFPKLERSEIVAYRSWVDSQIANNFTRSKVTTQNLNDVKRYGIYAQEANRDATAERNYPTNHAGTLLVYPSAYNVMQQYIHFRTGEIYQRNMNIDLRTWSEWRQVDGLNKVSKSGDTMTGTLTLPKLALSERNIAFGDDYLYKNNTTGALHGFHLFEDSGEPNDSKKGNARLFLNDVRTNHLGNGAYAMQYSTPAPYFVDEINSVARDTYHPFVKGRVRRFGQFGTAFSFGYTTYQGAQGTDGFGRGVIHLIEDSGWEKSWSFEHNGNFNSAGDVVTGSGHSLNLCRQDMDNFIGSNRYIKNLATNNNIQLRWASGNQLQLRVDATELGQLHYTNQAYVETTINNSDYGGANFKRRGNSGNWDSRIEPMPDKRWKFWVQHSHEIYLPVRAGTVALEGDSVHTQQKGHGAYSDQYNVTAPFYVDEINSVARDTYHPFVKGRVRRFGQFGTAFSFGYTTTQGEGDGFGRGVIHLIEDSGWERLWSFEHNGNFNSAGDVITGQGRSLNQMKEVAVLAGEVNHDGWIPLPEGFSEEQCRWMVSIRDDNPTNRGWDIEEDLTSTHYRFQCYTNGRQVIARTWQSGHGIAGSTWIPAKANYIIIGVK